MRADIIHNLIKNYIHGDYGMTSFLFRTVSWILSLLGAHVKHGLAELIDSFSVCIKTSIPINIFRNMHNFALKYYSLEGNGTNYWFILSRIGYS